MSNRIKKDVYKIMLAAFVLGVSSTLFVITLKGSVEPQKEVPAQEPERSVPLDNPIEFDTCDLTAGSHFYAHAPKEAIRECAYGNVCACDFILKIPLHLGLPACRGDYERFVKLKKGEEI